MVKLRYIQYIKKNLLLGVRMLYVQGNIESQEV